MGIPLLINQQILVPLFADDQVIISNTDDNFQRAVFTLNQIITELCLTVSVQKTKLMTFSGRVPFKSKIVKSKITE